MQRANSLEETLMLGKIEGLKEDGAAEGPLQEAWQPSPVFLPSEPHGQRSLVDYSPWGRKESDPTERLSTHARVLTAVWTFL